ncbi:RNA polymerase sigma-70 factor [Dyadobacter pollutisoli]|uniref:RNA polymerase sigma-70 factor n=1 Tax=Dyadobacter pollutisoli TaxID=2910158 RepID=A0A9E8N5C5_9BACT|nr:RNA polymerase sigma-70 factor [Dyadobacter pollutisoli]WAC10114.1 RNA polymerase sigma-70 factor [Dyadobacter pollutisoli]
MIATDDTQAFSEIYSRYKGVLYLHAFRMLGNEEEAKDVLQDLFTTIWTKRHDINHIASFSSYLYKALRNRIFDVMAHKKVEQKYIDSLARFMEEGECITDQQILEKELTQVIESEISLLPPRMREVFELSRNADLSYKQIAEELHISDKTVKKQVSSALHILRHKIDVAFIFALILLRN